MSDSAPCVEVAGLRLAFGLEWHPVAQPADPRPELRQARRAGYGHAVTLPDGSLIGLTRRLTGRGRPYSGVALLIAGFAERGAEACLIAAGPGVAFVGLMERRPVPGFDRLMPDLDAALALLQEFRDMHPDQTVRVASHLPGREQIGDVLAMELPFGQPDREARLRPLRRLPDTRVLIAGVALLSLAAAAAAWWLQREQTLVQAADEAAAARARAATATDRARARHETLARLLAAAGSPGNALLTRWRDAIADLPLSRAGWSLQRVDCDRYAGCVAHWARHHGSFDDLDRQPRGQLGAPTFASTRPPGADWLDATMTTVIAATGEPVAAGPADVLVQERLPRLRDAVNVWGSRLQDLALVGGRTSLASGAPFGAEAAGTGTAETATGVVRLEWRVLDGVWSLPLLDLPSYAVPETLTLTIAATQITYELTGSLFANGQSY